MIAIVGLGNIGSQYSNTFHNMGFMVIDKLAQKLGIDVSQQKYKALVGQGTFHGKSVMLVKPTTFMNNSGECLAEIKRKNKETRIIVVVDDIDLAKGKVRYRQRGSSGTHNGLRSIVSYIGEDFERVKIGIGRDTSKDLADYVLSRLSKEDEKILSTSVEEGAEMIFKLIDEKL